MIRGEDEDGPARTTPDYPAQIVAATERLLQSTSLTELNVARILKETGFARTTFYVHFSSKYGPVAVLLERAMDQIFDSVTAFMTQPGPGEVESSRGMEALARGLEEAGKVYRGNQTVLRAVSDHWHAVPELKILWVRLMQRFTDVFAREIDIARANDARLIGPPSQELAAALVWSSERVLHISAQGIDSNLPAEEQIMPILQLLWRNSVYGSTRD
jgi:AcrR family transcriptional regulator